MNKEDPVVVSGHIDVEPDVRNTSTTSNNSAFLDAGGATLVQSPSQQQQQPVQVEQRRGYSQPRGNDGTPLAPPTTTERWRNIYLARLPIHSFGDADLEQLVAPFGKVISARIMRQKGTGLSKGYAFVLFATEAAARACVEALNGRQHDAAHTLECRFAHQEASNPTRMTTIPEELAASAKTQSQAPPAADGASTTGRGRGASRGRGGGARDFRRGVNTQPHPQLPQLQRQVSVPGDASVISQLQNYVINNGGAPPITAMTGDAAAIAPQFHGVTPQQQQQLIYYTAAPPLLPSHQGYPSLAFQPQQQFFYVVPQPQQQPQQQQQQPQQQTFYFPQQQQQQPQQQAFYFPQQQPQQQQQQLPMAMNTPLGISLLPQHQAQQHHVDGASFFTHSLSSSSSVGGGGGAHGSILSPIGPVGRSSSEIPSLTSGDVLVAKQGDWK